MDSIPSFIDSVTSLLQDRPVTRTRLRVVLNRSGWSKKSQQNLQRIQNAVDEAGLYNQPRMNMRVNRDEWIRFSYSPFARQPGFNKENELRDFLLDNFRSISAFDNLHQPVAEVRLPSGRRVDILARDHRDNGFVVIEVKKSGGDIIGQVHRYLAEVRRELADGKPVRGMVVLGSDERELADVRSPIAGCEVEWFKYRFELNAL